MSTLELIYWSIVASLFICAFIKIFRAYRRISELKEKFMEQSLRLDNLVERMKMYDKSLAEIENDIKKQ